MNTSIKVVLFTSKTLNTGEHPVMLRIIKDRRVKYLSIGFNCSKELWDKTQNGPKKKHPLYKEAIIRIANKKLEAERLVYGLESEEKDLSAYELKRKLRRSKAKNASVIKYFDEVILRLQITGKIKNAEIYKDTKRNILKHASKELQFSDIDYLFLNRFEEHLTAAGKGLNTIYLYLRTLRALLNKAIKEEVCAEKYYPFKRFSLSKYSSIKTSKRAIKKEDMKKLAEVDLKDHPHLGDARNYFLFSFYCRGINFIDLAHLKWKDQQGGRLIYTRKKTAELFNLELMAPAKSILQYYKPLTDKGESSYIFPILNDGHVKPVTIYNRLTKMLRKFNRDLKELGVLAKVSSNLTSYVARHSYATIMKQMGVSTTVISQAMGHSSEKVTAVYLDSFANELVDEASKAIL